MVTVWSKEICWSRTGNRAEGVRRRRICSLSVKATSHFSGYCFQGFLPPPDESESCLHESQWSLCITSAPCLNSSLTLDESTQTTAQTPSVEARLHQRFSVFIWNQRKRLICWKPPPYRTVALQAPTPVIFPPLALMFLYLPLRTCCWGNCREWQFCLALKANHS